MCEGGKKYEQVRYSHIRRLGGCFYRRGDGNSDVSSLNRIKKMKRITILLDDKVAADLAAKAERTGATMSGQIRAAIKLWLAQSEAVTAVPTAPEEEF